MKKYILLLHIFFLIFLAPNFVQAEEQAIKLFIDGEKANTDVPPMMSSTNRVLVPVRVISESLGYSVYWNDETREVFLRKDSVIIKFNMDEPKLWKNDKEIDLDVAPVVHNGRTLLPIRAVSENIGAIVNWDNETRSVLIQTQAVSNNPGVNNYSEIKQNEIAAISQTGTTLKIQTTENIAQSPSLIELKDPHRLVIDFNDMLLPEQLETSGFEENDLISNIRYSQFELNPNKVRIVIDLKYKADYSFNYTDNSITIDLKPHIYKVILDAGHGGTDPGAVSITGRHEKDLNLAIALKAASLLKDELNIQPILTRESDTFIALDDRVKLANDSNADLFISIHGNALPNKSNIHGIETYYTRPESLSFAKIIHQDLLQDTGFTDRGILTADFRVIKNTQMPAVLLETGYLTNKTEEKIMFTSIYQQKVAEAIEKAIKEYLNNL